MKELPSEALPQALEALRYRLKNVLSHYQIPPADAADLVQETAVVTLEKWEQIADLQAWLVAVLRNRCLMYLRKSRQRHSRDVSISPAMEENLPSKASRVLARLEAEAVLGKLPPRLRRLSILRYSHGLKLKDAARAVGYRPESVRKLIERARPMYRRGASG